MDQWQTLITETSINGEVLCVHGDDFIYTKVAKGREATNVILYQISKPPSLAFDAKIPATLRDALRPWCKKIRPDSSRVSTTRLLHASHWSRKENAPTNGPASIRYPIAEAFTHRKVRWRVLDHADEWFHSLGK
jgi:hypothetical protein